MIDFYISYFDTISYLITPLRKRMDKIKTNKGWTKLKLTSQYFPRELQEKELHIP